MKKRNMKVGMLLGISTLLAIHSALITVPGAETENAAEVQTEAQTEAQISEETEAVQSRAEIFTGSSVSYLDESDTEGLDAQVLAYARYEIMARKGVLFDSEELNSYFTSQNWYFGFIPENTADDSMFTDCELANMKLLQAAEKAASENGTGYLLDQPGWTSDAVLTFRGVIAETSDEEETEAATEEVTEEMTETATEEMTEAATEEVTEEMTEAATEEVTEEMTEAATEEVTEEMTEAATEEVTEEMTEAVTEAVTEAPAAPLVPRQVKVPSGALAEGLVEAGDIVNIDFRGSSDGKAVRGAEGENFNVLIGSGALGAEIEEGLIGAGIGEVLTIPVSYPAVYNSDALAGRDVVYEVVVNYIYRLSQKSSDSETETQVTEAEIQETGTETQVTETETQVTETETQETETETQVTETEIQETETETQATETEIQETETEEQETETLATETEIQETETEEQETETLVTETETEVNEAIYGMLAETVSEEESTKFHMPSGAYLISVEPRSAAGLAGLLAGDVITGVDRASVNSAEFMQMLLSSYQEGDEAVIRYQRLDAGVYKEYIAKMTLLKEVDDEAVQAQTSSQETERTQPETRQHAEGPGTAQGVTGQQHAEGPATAQAGPQQNTTNPQQNTANPQQHTANPQTSQVIVGNNGFTQWPQSGPTVLDEYIFPDVDMRYLTDGEVNVLSLQQVCYAKNEVYAIHGRQFVSVELQQYFGSKSWYYGFVAPADFTDTVFNDFERANIQKLVNRENELSGGAGYKLDQPGYDISLAGTASLK